MVREINIEPADPEMPWGFGKWLTVEIDSENDLPVPLEHHFWNDESHRMFFGSMLVLMWVGDGT